MRLGQALIFLGLLCVRGLASAQSEYEGGPNPFWKEDTKEVTIRAAIHPKLPRFVFHILGEQGYIGTIEIWKKGEKKPSQVIYPEPVETTHGTRYFFVEDVNFDGYADIALFSYQGATGNSGYLYWLFDRDTGQFVFHPASSALDSVDVDRSKHVIRSFENGGMAGHVYKSGVYRFEGTELIPIRLEEQDWDQARHVLIRTVQVRKGGKMTVVSRRTIREPEWYSGR